MYGQTPFISAKKKGKFDAFGLKYLSLLRPVKRHRTKPQQEEFKGGLRSSAMPTEEQFQQGALHQLSSMQCVEKNRFLSRNGNLGKVLFLSAAKERQKWWFLRYLHFCLCRLCSWLVNKEGHAIWTFGDGRAANCLHLLRKA